MSIENSESIDFIGVNDEQVTLLVSDHLPWGHNDDEHMYMLQEKINSYLKFYESGELVQKYPAAIHKKICIEVVFKNQTSEKGNWFLDKLRPVLSEAGVSLVITYKEEESSRKT